MWYLQTDTLLLTLAAAVLAALYSAVTRRTSGGSNMSAALVLLDMALLIYIDRDLAVFYAAYTVLTYAMVTALRYIKGARRPFFVLFCFLAAVPFFYTRTAALFDSLPKTIALTGFAYNMLKAIDALFYVYYTGERVPLLTYSNFILFFPVFTAGPIYRYRDFSRCLEAPGKIDSARVEGCVKRLIRGLFKKVVLLELIGIVSARMAELGTVWYLSLITAALSYLTVYLDLSGYSDIAIAVGGIMGFDVPENFKSPITAATFTQFWRKWHSTLSDWIREHIFVVVQGKRLKKWQGAIIGFCTMLIMSLWHDFSPLNMISGVYMGIFLVYENLTGHTTVDRRRTSKHKFFLHCLAVNFLFSINTMFFLMEPAQVLRVVRGFFVLRRTVG